MTEKTAQRTAQRTAKPKAPRVRTKAASKPKASPKPQAQAAPEPKAEPRAEPKPEPRPEAAAEAQSPFDGLSAEQRAALETLSMNLARAALTAQGAIAEAALRQADRPAALTPDPFHVAPAMTDVMGRLVGQPDRLMRAQADLFSRYMSLWGATARRMSSGETVETVAAPAKGDKRFNDPDWTDNPLFDVMKQSYLISAGWMNELVAEVQGVDPMTKRRAEFFMKMLTDAFAPSNFLLSNPAALREAVATQGESLVKGMDNFAADLERGGGQLSISQTDSTPFKVGENIATAPGKVVFQNELIQILQFAATTEEVFEIPLLIFPPWINKYYILDLRPENSMIRWLTGKGFTVFVTSWVNPDQRLAEQTFEDYMVGGIYAACHAVLTQARVAHVNAVGYCIGGTLLSCALAHMAAKRIEPVASATFFAAQQDFSEAGDLMLFTDEAWIGEVEKKMDAAGGVLSGQAMADTFNALRANDLIWSFFVNNYLMGKEPKPFDLLYWNADQTRMPKALHLYYLREFYQQNRLAKGELVLGGEPLDLKRVKIPIFVQSSKEDHIAPYRSVYRGARLFGGPTQFILAGSGHIAGVINPPDAHKYQHWTNPHLPPTVEAWLEEAVEHPGSWWTHWAAWLAERSGRKVPARDPAKGPLKPIEDAPGSFVRVRS
jgi:polyhydroxyalkanoate synthase